MTRFSTCVSRVADAVVANGDACVVWNFLLQAKFAYYTCVCDILSSIHRYVVVVDGAKGVGAINAFGSWIILFGAHGTGAQVRWHRTGPRLVYRLGVCGAACVQAFGLMQHQGFGRSI